ncbi:hypothetical protein pb186bvf_003451, partial [Paramecium bursaria]
MNIILGIRRKKVKRLMVQPLNMSYIINFFFQMNYGFMENFTHFVCHYLYSNFKHEVSQSQLSDGMVSTGF